MNKHYKLGSRVKQAGFSLIEIMVVLVIAGLILAGVAWGINKSFNSNDIKDTNTALTSVMSSIPELRTTTGYGADGTSLTPALVAQNSVPSVWPNTGTQAAPTIKNAWNGNVTVLSRVDHAELTLTAVPKEACNKLTTKISSGSNFRTTKIGTNPAITGPVTAAQAAAQCVDDNTISWTTTS